MKKGITTLIYDATRDVIAEYAVLIGKLVLICIAVFFLGVNIFFSQNIHPLYFGLIDERRDATVLFLRKIHSLSSFRYFLSQYTAVFGQELPADVEEKNEERKNLIEKYESLLAKNPSSRDLLYALAQLYYESGRYELSHTYFLKAQAIDPTLK